MKTISMPIEEYEQALKEARQSGAAEAYRSGAVEMAFQIAGRMSGFATGDFQDSSLLKVANDAIAKIKRSTLKFEFMKSGDSETWSKHESK